MGRRVVSLVVCVGLTLRSSKCFCQVLCSAVARCRLLHGAELMSDSGELVRLASASLGWLIWSSCAFRGLVIVYNAE